MGREIIHKHRRLTVYLFEHVPGELFEGVCVVTTMEYLEMHNTHLLTYGPDDSDRLAAVAGHVYDGVLTCPRPGGYLPRVEGTFIHVDKVFSFHHQLRNLLAHLMLLLLQLIHLFLLSIVGVMGLPEADPMLSV